MNGPRCAGGTALRRVLRHRSYTASPPVNAASAAKYARGPNAVIKPPASSGPMAAEVPFSRSSACSLRPSAPAQVYR